MTSVPELLERVRVAAPSFAGVASANKLDTGDQLALALADIAAHYGRVVSREQVTSGLPLVGGLLPLEHIEPAARRAGLNASIVTCRLDDLADHDMPVLVLTADGGVDVLWSVLRAATNIGSAAALNMRSLEMSAPGQPDARVLLDIDEVASSASGRIIRLTPVTRLDERGEGALADPGKHEWLFSVFRSSRRVYAEAITATIAINVLALAMPLFTMNVYDRVLPNAAVDTLWALSIGVILATIFDFALKTLRGKFVDTASQRADVVLANFIYGRILGARLPSRPVSAGVRANTLREFESLREFFNSATVTTFGDLPFLALFLVVMAVVAGPLALIAIVSIPFVIGLGWIVQKRMARLTAASFKETAQKNAVAVEMLVGLESIKAAGAESAAASRWEQAVADHLRTSVQIRHQSNAGMNMVQAAQSLIQVVMIIAGFYMVAAGQITTGALIAATMLAGRALGPVGAVAMLLTRVHQAKIAYNSLSEIVHAPQERSDGARFVAKTSFEGRITFEGVSFAYDPEAGPVLRDVSIEIGAGEHVGIIGGIGSGKTTLLKFVPALHEPTSGRVLIDGLGASQIDPAILRGHASLMLQGADLFHGTIRSNITLGMPGAPDELVLRAAHTAGAIDWIARLPKGLDTPVRERGVGLSGGQRQGVVLARSLLRNPRILLLDEPTSDMDGRTEATVIERLGRVMKGRTLLIVTHRPALLDLVDRLIVMEQGRKLFDGPKAQVLDALKQVTTERKKMSVAP
jgi:ATP-binding cassette, subfamily C, bacterial LapB